MHKPTPTPPPDFFVADKHWVGVTDTDTPGDRRYVVPSISVNLAPSPEDDELLPSAIDVLTWAEATTLAIALLQAVQLAERG
jgi:hypothetical protein